MKGLLEYKTMTAEVKDVDLKSMKVSGYWASYGNKDYDRDIIEMGAARKTIMERGPKGSNEIFFLNQHNWDQPHGKPSVLEDQAKGIYFEANVAPTSYGKDSLILYEAGIVIQHSIGFQTIKSEDSGSYQDGTFTRHIKEIKLFEGSNVTLGANPNTPFTGFKSLTFEQTNDQIQAIVKLIRNGTLTDDMFLQLEIALKQLQKHSYELGKQDVKSLNTEPEITSTPEPNEPIVENEIINTLKNWNLN
jgi:HK97 family phage prohead protease